MMILPHNILDLTMAYTYHCVALMCMPIHHDLKPIYIASGTICFNRPTITMTVYYGIRSQL